MKNDRQNTILEIIAAENIETQEQLLDRLAQRGIRSTQATISRDIKQMHLIKEPVGQGVYRYAVSVNRARLNVADKLRTIFKESITSVDSAQNMVVIKTLSGLAGGACEALDHMDIAGLVGSLAGDEHGLPGDEGYRRGRALLSGDPGDAVTPEGGKAYAGAAAHRESGGDRDRRHPVLSRLQRPHRRDRRRQVHRGGRHAARCWGAAPPGTSSAPGPARPL